MAATELAHLRVAGQPRDTVAVLNVDFVLRASGVLSIAALIASFTTGMLAVGIALHFAAKVPVSAGLNARTPLHNPRKPGSAMLTLRTIN